MFRLILSMIIGYILGLERKKHDKAGGSRTMALISFTACFLAVLSKELAPHYSFDFVRLIAYLLPALGFLGMGVIHRSNRKVDGLTTSATLLALLPIGFALGLGYFFYGIVGSILIWAVLESKYWGKK